MTTPTPPPEAMDKAPQMPELKPCPFCGGKAKKSIYLDDPKVTCVECGIFFLSPDAIKDWQTRADPVPQPHQETGERLGELKLQSMMRDPKYWRDRDPAHIQKVADGFSRLYANQTAIAQISPYVKGE